ncbi:MAG: ubiquinol-cytochrome c reductase iron-sulfur subunit [bacterium]
MSEEKSEAMQDKTPSEKAEEAKAAQAGEPPTKPASKSEERVKAAKLSPKKKVAVDEQGSIWMSRRNFFSRAGWVAFFSFVGSMLIGSLRFMFPRVLFEPSPVFKAGFPDDYPVGTVNTKWVKDKRVWIVRNEEGIYAIIAICTHLGCTPRWLDAENKFKCPCHGSGFTREGINFEGPAPRPLERAQITLAEDGQILVNKSIKFLEEKAEWGKPGSILRV